VRFLFVVRLGTALTGSGPTPSQAGDGPPAVVCEVHVDVGLTPSIHEFDADGRFTNVACGVAVDR
jgi:hypothetical protein